MKLKTSRKPHGIKQLCEKHRDKGIVVPIVIDIVVITVFVLIVIVIVVAIVIAIVNIAILVINDIVAENTCRRRRRCHPRQQKNNRTVATTEQQQSSNIIGCGGEHAPTPHSFSASDGWKSERTWRGNRSTSIEWRAHGRVRTN